MTGDGTGYWQQRLIGQPSPSSGIPYRLYYTESDWDISQLVLSGGGGLGCCMHTLIDVVPSGRLFYMINNQGYRKLWTISVIGNDVVHQELSALIAGPTLGFSVMNDSTCAVAQMNLNSSARFSVSSPGSLELRDTLSHYPVRDVALAFYNEQIGAALIQTESMGQWIRVTEDGGWTWEHVFNAPDSTFIDLEWLDVETLYVVGEQGAMIRTSDNGFNWDTVQIPTSNNIHEVVGYGPDSIWVGGDNGTVLVSGDAGQSWEDISVGEGSIVRIQVLEGAVYAYTRIPDGEWSYAYRLYKLNSKPHQANAHSTFWSINGNGVELHLMDGERIEYITITDLGGRVVPFSQTGEQLGMDIVASGVYIIHIRTDKRTGVAKLTWVRQ
ncbi:MAG: hypothetical protein KDB88_13000 [Flavobacteriales bacterium]|nr:hypothetical protein [Flavobacteriales bacterium]